MVAATVFNVRSGSGCLCTVHVSYTRKRLREKKPTRDTVHLVLKILAVSLGANTRGIIQSILVRYPLCVRFSVPDIETIEQTAVSCVTQILDYTDDVIYGRSTRTCVCVYIRIISLI